MQLDQLSVVFFHANLPFVLADFFLVVLRDLLTDHWAGIVTLRWQGCIAHVLSTYEFHSRLL